jgi:hypothetical protein
MRSKAQLSLEAQLVNTESRSVGCKDERNESSRKGEILKTLFPGKETMMLEPNTMASGLLLAGRWFPKLSARILSRPEVLDVLPGLFGSVAEDE